MTILLCADDFAQNKEISAGILELAYQKRLSAISCMTKMPIWSQVALDLIPLKKQNPNIQLGIHFNLTHGQEAFIRPLPYWLALSWMACINRNLIRRIFSEQCEAFENELGQAPDFIDGHQHVHALPIIRDIIIEVIQTRYANKLPWVRNVNFAPTQGRTLKTYILQCATYGFTKKLVHHKIPHNAYFAGLYDLKPESDFQALIDNWFKNAPDNTLIMCHPGLASNDKTDPIASTRIKEFQVLAGEWFNQYCLNA